MNKFVQETIITRTIMTKEELMRRAIALSEESVRKGGGPFGAVIARDGVVVAEASNRVILDSDPTAHAEVSAIRAASLRLGTFDLSGCDIYTSCEPCPMCLGAIYWAHLDRIYQEIALAPADRHKPMRILLPDEAKKAFEAWRESDNKTEY